MKRVLLTKLSSLGDLVHALPALSDAMNQIPGITFDWVVDKNFKDVPLWHPSVHNLFLTSHRVWRKHLFSEKTRTEFSKFYQKLREEKYDLIIDAQGNIKSALFSCIPEGKRAGWDGSSTPEWGSHFFYHTKYEASKKIHAIERIRHLLAGSLGYEVPKIPPNYQIDLSKLKKTNLDLPSSYVMFVPIASYASKLWPETRWKELIEKALKEGYFILLPWGNEKEKERAERLKSSEKVIVLPHLSIDEIGYLLWKAKAVVSVDTGLSHIAAALSTPCVTLYGPTDPHLTGTIGENQHWIRASHPCESRCKKNCATSKKEPECLQKISSEEVWKKLSYTLEAVSSSSSK